MHGWILVIHQNWNVILVFNEMRGRKIPQNAWWHLWVLYFRCYKKQGFQWPLGWHFQHWCSLWSCTFHSYLRSFEDTLIERIKSFKETWVMSHLSPPFSAKQWWTYHEVGEKRLLCNPCETLALGLSNNITIWTSSRFSSGGIYRSIYGWFSVQPS